MSFNPDLNKQAQEVIFSRKLNKSSHPKIYFNNAPVVCVNWQKHLGMFFFLDGSLNFIYYLKEKISKAMKGIDIKKLEKTFPQHFLMTILSFVRPHLDYGNIIYDQPNNESLNQKIERIQYNATGAIKGTSQSELHNKLGFESLKFRCCFRKLCVFYKIKITRVPEYLFDLIPENNHIYNNRLSGNVKTFYVQD